MFTQFLFQWVTEAPRQNFMFPCPLAKLLAAFCKLFFPMPAHDYGAFLKRLCSATLILPNQIAWNFSIQCSMCLYECLVTSSSYKWGFSLSHVLIVCGINHEFTVWVEGFSAIGSMPIIPPVLLQTWKTVLLFEWVHVQWVHINQLNFWTLQSAE